MSKLNPHKITKGGSYRVEKGKPVLKSRSKGRDNPGPVKVEQDKGTDKAKSAGKEE